MEDLWGSNIGHIMGNISVGVKNIWKQDNYTLSERKSYRVDGFESDQIRASCDLGACECTLYRHSILIMVTDFLSSTIST